MSKSERNETLTALTSLIFSSLLDELVLDATIQSHHEIARSAVVCKVCNTSCNTVHIPGSLSNFQQSSSSQGAASSRSGTPSSNGDGKPGASGSNGTSTPNNGKGDGNLYLDCISCSRQIASNRYATHLGSCMGLANSRRGASRLNAKIKASSDAGRSASPSSELGYISDERGNNKSKGKSRRDDESSFVPNKRKRPSSPQRTPSKKTKGKASGSPISRVKAGPDVSGVPSSQSHFSPTTNSQSRVPSKLRDSSTASFLDRSSDSSRSSSPEGASVPTPASSSFTQSPSLAARVVHTAKSARGRPMGTGPPKRPSPPRPPPTIHHFAMDVDEGDETGSSTDTSDSS